MPLASKWMFNTPKLGGSHPGWCYGKYDELQTRWTSLVWCCHGLNFVQIAAAAGELAA